MTNYNAHELQSEFSNAFYGHVFTTVGIIALLIFIALFIGPEFGLFKGIDTTLYIFLLGLIVFPIEVLLSLKFGEVTIGNAVVSRVKTPGLFFLRVGISCFLALSMLVALILRIKGAL